MSDMKPEEKVCALCGEVILAYQSDEEAQDAFERMLGVPFSRPEVNKLCADCWRKIDLKRTGGEG